MFHSVSYSEFLIGLDWIPAQAQNDGRMTGFIDSIF